MTEEEKITECIKSLHWLKFCIVGTEEPNKNTFEYATMIYIDTAIELLTNYRARIKISKYEI